MIENQMINEAYERMLGRKESRSSGDFGTLSLVRESAGVMARLLSVES